MTAPERYVRHPVRGTVARADLVTADGVGEPGWAPVAVIDPESADDLNRFVDECLAAGATVFGDGVEMLREALRRFAAPTPPKPPEPTGLGAVVELRNGKRSVRADDDDVPWRVADLIWAVYADLDVVRILSEGVQP